MQALSALKPHAAQMLGVLTDIDDTLTTRGKLTGEAYRALEALQAAGLKVMPITGGPASLALHAARLWPVDAAVGESGAMLYHHDGKTLHTEFWDDEATRAQQAASRAQIITRIRREIPRAQLASDQHFRLCDLAINLAEDLNEQERLSSPELHSLRALLNEEAYTMRQSSIHLNAWRGTYDKLPMAKRALKKLWGVDIEAEKHRWLYVGDAPNDEAMFEFFPLSVGVANIARYLPQMQHHPAYLATQEAGAGFAEITAVLLDARR